MDLSSSLRSLRLGGVTLGLLLLSSQHAMAQSAIPRDTLLSAARTIMSAARYCALVTLDGTGTPQARTMDPFAPDEEFVVWMGTNRTSRKVQQLQADPRVTLFYASPAATGYVTIIGRAELVDDESEKAARWKPEWERFYQDRASEYLLIRIIPERLEVVDYSRGISGDPGSWATPFVVFR